ncbi:hypothetical protein F5J12DRAFT_784454 [Pisolithus orientalis]|uniref:uncharacterized protein n=1 Tax=Pisolithus orientalis TaxID=936130 RepID=UPI002224049E|nr:uncharacterized protein F5J12DRAFT_784454 [Pisolithus orientalis]KAI6000140.1 hypothetical protein F5J12DRAFT_784454 [Pisolithus orientalis]
MGPEGVYMPLEAFKQEFSKTKLSCQLIAVQKDATIKTACADFPMIVGNVRALETLIPSKKGTTLKDKNVYPDTASVEEVQTADWLVQEWTRMALDHAVTTHMDKKSVFSSILCEMVVLHEPPPPTYKPSQKICVWWQSICLPQASHEEIMPDLMRDNMSITVTVFHCLLILT